MSISLLARANVASLSAIREQVLPRLQASTDGAHARRIAQARQLADSLRIGRATEASVAVCSARDQAHQEVLGVTVQDDGLGGDLADADMGAALMNRLTQGGLSLDGIDEGLRVTGLISR